MVICYFWFLGGEKMKELIISMSILFLVKVLDNVLGTMKTIFIQRNKMILSTIIDIETLISNSHEFLCKFFTGKDSVLQRNALLL